MGLGGTNEDGKPSLEPARPKPVIAKAAGGVLGAYVARARQDSAVRQDEEGGHDLGRGLVLIKQKKKMGPQRSSRNKKSKGNTSGRKQNPANGGSGLTEAERQQLAVQSQIAEEKARRYEAIERGEIAADDECNVDFSTRAPPEPAQKRSETPPSPSGSDVSPTSSDPGWRSQGFQRQRSRSPSPDHGYSNRHAGYANERASPVYDAHANHPGERASPTYEPYRARSRERDSPQYDNVYPSGRKGAGLGYGGSSVGGYDHDGHPRSEAKERMMQQHHEEFLKRQEKWQLADDEKQRQRQLLKEALPGEQARIRRVLAQAEKQRKDDDAMQERLVDLMIAKEKAERKAKRKAAKKNK